MDDMLPTRSPGCPTRRDFIRATVAVTGLTALARVSPGRVAAAYATNPVRDRAAHGFDGPGYPISLAQWSLHRALYEGGMDPLDFPRVAKTEYGLDAVEYVNSFYRDLPTDWVRELNSRCEAVKRRITPITWPRALRGIVNIETMPSASNASGY